MHVAELAATLTYHVKSSAYRCMPHRVTNVDDSTSDACSKRQAGLLFRQGTPLPGPDARNACRYIRNICWCVSALLEEIDTHGHTVLYRDGTRGHTDDL
jgi:hypothetical protein